MDRARTKKEFYHLPQNESLRKQIKGSAIICYVCGGYMLLMAVLSHHSFLLVDASFVALSGAGVQFSQSRAFAIALAVYALGDLIIGVIISGFLNGWFPLMSAAFVCYSTFKLQKEWKEYSMCKEDSHA